MLRKFTNRSIAKEVERACAVGIGRCWRTADPFRGSRSDSHFSATLAVHFYVTFTDRSVNAYNAYRKDSIIKLTRKGVDLVEGTINDPGIDV